jgi:hypothetical protein
MHVLSANASTHVQRVLRVSCMLPDTGVEQNWWCGTGQTLASSLMA